MQRPRTRWVYGIVTDNNNAPVTAAQVKTLTNVAVSYGNSQIVVDRVTFVETDDVIDNAPSEDVQKKEPGKFRIELVCTGDLSNAVKHKITFPVQDDQPADAAHFKEFYLPYGDGSAIEIGDAILDSTVPPDITDNQSLTDFVIALINEFGGSGGGWDPGNQTANKVYAAPDNTTGLPTFRTLVAGDIPNLSAAKITSGTFATVRIADNAITFAKFQNIATARLLGRTTAGGGSVEEIRVGAGLQLADGELSATGGGSGGGISIGDAIGGATVKSILFAGTGGILAQNNTKFSWDNTTNAEKLLVKSGGVDALTVESAGGNDSATLLIKNTNTDANYPSQVYISNAAQGTNGVIRVINANGINNHSFSNDVSHSFTTNSYNLGAFSSKYGAPTLAAFTVRPEQVGLSIYAKSGQTAKLVEFLDSTYSAIGGVSKNGGIIPASMSDSNAENNTIYYSTDAGRLVYKDSSGNIANLD